MSLTLGMLQNATMTISECAKYSKQEYLGVLIACLICLLLYAVMLIIVSIKYGRLKSFVESDVKLVKRFREFNDDRKGL